MARTKCQPAEERVAHADPNHPRAHYMLGLCYVNSGDLPRAKEHLQTFIRLAPKDKEAATAEEMIKYSAPSQRFDLESLKGHFRVTAALVRRHRGGRHSVPWSPVPKGCGALSALGRLENLHREARGCPSAAWTIRAVLE
jgi:tetratricopeptide (TPR) repeat protein